MTDNPAPEGIKLSTQKDQYSIVPGGKLEIPITLVNPGNVADQVRISVEGIPLFWVSTEQLITLLQPGEERQVILTIQPPPMPNAPIGRYNLGLRAESVIVSGRSAQIQIKLTVAGFEVKGRLGVLLESLQYAVHPGEQVEIPLVFINQGLAADTFRLSVKELPAEWTVISTPAFQLEPGESQQVSITITPPRLPSARASRYSFQVLASSQAAPDQGASIDCTLTVAAFIDFSSALEAPQPDQNLPARVSIQNQSNIPVTFQVNWSSPEDTLIFEPAEPARVNLPLGETAVMDYSAQPKRRPLFGGEKSFLYTVTVQASDQQAQNLEGAWPVKALLPIWVLIAGLVGLVILCVILFSTLFRPGADQEQLTTETPAITSTATAVLPTATQSQIDQRPWLIERTWFLVAFNEMRSSPGVQEPFTLFNPDGTLVGYTGCKDLRADYQTNYNQLSISGLSLGTGTCPDAALQQQEDAMVAILRSSRTYFVADTALQVAGDAGFLNYSLSAVSRPEEVLPPQAVIRAVPQSEVGQVVVFDGSASSGQAPIVSWRWDFGDGGSASGAVVQHLYSAAGTFTVSLTVADQRGQSGVSNQQIHILALPTPTNTPIVPSPTAPPAPLPTPEQPTATPEPLPQPEAPQASITGPAQGYIAEPVTFDASASQPGSSQIVSFAWRLGNGVDLPPSPESSVSVTYNRAGDYEVIVLVAAADGLTSYATTRINIDARLETDVWTLSQYNQTPLLPGTAITLQFKEGELAGFAGCNTYTGGYTAVDNGDGSYGISLGQLTTSRLACPMDIMGQESAYLSLLQQATTANIQENSIVLSSPAGELLFYLVEADELNPR